MALCEITDRGLTQQDSAQFAAQGLCERQDLQQYLRKQDAALGDDLLIIAEEFGQWTDGRRRIDLLGIDRDGCLVVIELKRPHDRRRMELQALRYAAMVASMGFDEVVDAFEEHLTHQKDAAAGDARDTLRRAPGCRTDWGFTEPEHSHRDTPGAAAHTGKEADSVRRPVP